ncbi:hypothetical protein J6590_062808 [Homalodisca vitripennis]|nr:hypothetical protein J6590_062808 [Homalodisca vitripennis]
MPSTDASVSSLNSPKSVKRLVYDFPSGVKQGFSTVMPTTDASVSSLNSPKSVKRLVYDFPSGVKQGFQYSDAYHRCIDVDECTEPESPCDSNQVCENTMGSYSCQCKSGFQLDSITQACIDINECQVDLHNCLPSQRCDNTIGSFQCVRYTSCGTGYTLNAQTGLCEGEYHFRQIPRGVSSG